LVGYSSTNPNSVRASPLFNLRTNRAIDNGEDVTTCDFIGKGKLNSIPLPTFDNTLALIRQLIDRIGKLDSN